MTPAARLAAAAELLDLIIADAQAQRRPADRLIQRYFRNRRYAGAKDRRAVQAKVYAVLRAHAGLATALTNAGLPVTGRTLALLAEPAGDPTAQVGGRYGLAPLSAEERTGLDRARQTVRPQLIPAWLRPGLITGYGEDLAALDASFRDRAPVDLRANPLKAATRTVRAGLAAQDIVAEILPWPSGALRLGADTPAPLEVVQAGLAEVQDAAAQWAAAQVPARPGQTVIDLCAGAGGKSLALAGQMADQGRLIACDVAPAKLREAERRAARAGVTILHTQPVRPAERADQLQRLAGHGDHVVLDVPCSGSGTWRRNPDLALRLTPKRLTALGGTQERLLDEGAALVRPGGTLSYMTCSILAQENADQVSAFLARREDFRPEPLTDPVTGETRQWLQLLPSVHHTDGFFVCVMRHRGYA
ncbi:MAG: RsmB/NOP family class I SAM-dependent RNA methyltransferase [Rhodothalassiaceae bacterium]